MNMIKSKNQIVTSGTMKIQFRGDLKLFCINVLYSNTFI